MNKIPNSLEEAYIELDNMLVKEDKGYIVECGALSVHHSLGRWIRNNWGLWEETPNTLKSIFLEKNITHPDDISNYIIKSYIEHLKNESKSY